MHFHKSIGLLSIKCASLYTKENLVLFVLLPELRLQFKAKTGCGQHSIH